MENSSTTSAMKVSVGGGQAETELSSTSGISASSSFEKDNNTNSSICKGGGGEDEAVIIPRWFPRCCGKPILHGKPEALGWLLSMSGQTMGVIGVGTFVIPALIYYGKIEAGCEVEIPEGETTLPECHNKAYGLKPSSFVTTFVTAISVLVAVINPLFGAFVDYTNHRRRFGRILSFCYVCCIIPLCFMNENNWFPLMPFLLLMLLSAQTLTLVLHAYLPDLTDSEEELNDLTRSFIALPGLQNMIFIVAVIATTVGMGAAGQEGPTARTAATFGVFVLGTYFTMAWGYLMKPRPALNTLQEGQVLFLQGFQQIGRTLKNLYTTNLPLLWFYTAVALGDVKPLMGIGLTFLSSQQQFDSTDIGIASMMMLFSLVPGAMLSAYVCRKLNPVWSSVLSVLAMIVVTGAASIFLTGPNQKPQTFVAVAGWGISGGWKVTSTAMLVAAIVPEGQDAELMGFYLFSDTALSWAPPLIFTAMNEAGLSERIGLSSIIIFWVLGLFAYWKMGSYDDRVKAANRLVVVAPASAKDEADNNEVVKKIAPTTAAAAAAAGDQENPIGNSSQQSPPEEAPPPNTSAMHGNDDYDENNEQHETVQIDSFAKGGLSDSTNDVYVVEVDGTVP